MNTGSNSIRKKTFIYLLSYSAIILLLLWLFQIVFLKIFFERYQYNKIIEVASKISENNLENLEEEIYNNDMCAEVYYGDKIYGYNTQNKDCILNSNNTKIINAKNKIITGTSKKSLIKIIDPRYDSKSIIYGLKLNNNIYIILNTKLEDVNSTTNVLSGQLIYITFIVIILSGIMSILVSNMLNKPILKITSKAKEMAKGNYEPDEEIYNIKELDELRTTLNYAKSEIKNTDELRKDLMANVSHDLKTPLTMIKAYAEMIRDINFKDKKKMRIVGFTFILSSGLVYFLSMLGIGFILDFSTVIYIRNIIALLAVILGIYNLYVYIKTRKDTGCSVINDKKRTKIFTKIKKFTTEKNFILALLGTITLAITVNLVELACSAGLPVMYIEILSMNGLSTLEYVCYLIVYVLFFMLDDIIVFFIAMTTMQVTGFSTKYGKFSHLIGGILLLLIGIIMILKPEWLMFNF